MVHVPGINVYNNRMVRVPGVNVYNNRTVHVPGINVYNNRNTSPGGTRMVYRHCLPATIIDGLSLNLPLAGKLFFRQTEESDHPFSETPNTTKAHLTLGHTEHSYVVLVRERKRQLIVETPLNPACTILDTF